MNVYEITLKVKRDVMGGGQINDNESTWRVLGIDALEAFNKAELLYRKYYPKDMEIYSLKYLSAKLICVLDEKWEK